MSMSETAPDEPGLMGRPSEPKPSEANLPHETGASWSEGAPDFTTAAAAGDLPPVQPTLT